VAAIFRKIMYWQEKIDRLKKSFSPREFQDRYTDWPQILKKIEAKFVKKYYSSYHFSNWSENLKNKILIRTISDKEVFVEIKKLLPNQNYWVVLVSGTEAAAKHLVYDCSPNSMEALLSMTSTDFYIIDKAYKWLISFEIDEIHNKVTLTKATNSQTPFDK
jgi:hypothetical protein